MNRAAELIQRIRDRIRPDLRIGERHARIATRDRSVPDRQPEYCLPAPRHSSRGRAQTATRAADCVRVLKARLRKPAVRVRLP